MTELLYLQLVSVGVLVLIVFFFPLNGLKVALEHPPALIQDDWKNRIWCRSNATKTETAIFSVLWWLLSSLYYIFVLVTKT